MCLLDGGAGWINCSITSPSFIPGLYGATATIFTSSAAGQSLGVLYYGVGYSISLHDTTVANIFWES